jgi:multidrug efflux pump
MSRFFINRPIFALVIAIVLMLLGSIAITQAAGLAIPRRSRRPTVAINATYPGADAQTLENTTTQIIEQQLKGIDQPSLLLVQFQSRPAAVTITLTFEQGTNADIAQVQVQNKLQAATPLLPQEVQQQGIRVVKATQNFLIFVGLYSDNRASCTTATI